MIIALCVWAGGYLILAALAAFLKARTPIHEEHVPAAVFLLLLGWPLWFVVTVVLMAVAKIRGN